MWKRKDVLTIRGHHVDSLWIIQRDLRAEGIEPTTEAIIQRRFQNNVQSDRNYMNQPDHTGGTEEGAAAFYKGLAKATRRVLEDPDDTEVTINMEMDEVCRSCQGPKRRHCHEIFGADRIAIWDIADYFKENNLPGELQGDRKKNPSVNTTLGPLRRYIYRPEFHSNYRRLTND